MAYAPRARRVPMSGAKVHLANMMARLVNVSRTGALVRAGRELVLGSDWPLMMELDATLVCITGRVVRAEPASTIASGIAAREFAIAFTFVAPSADTRKVLDSVCEVTRPEVGVNLGWCRVSMARHCPACFSRAVARSGVRRYTCDDCNQAFHGFRVGPIRIAY